MASESEKIAEWDKSKLQKFIDRRITSKNTLPTSFDGEVIRTTVTLGVDGDIELSPQAVNKLKSYLGL